VSLKARSQLCLQQQGKEGLDCLGKKVSACGGWPPGGKVR